MHIVITYGLIGRGGDAIQLIEISKAMERLGHTVRLVGPLPIRAYEFKTKQSRLRDFLRKTPWWIRDVFEIGMNVKLYILMRRTVRKYPCDLLFHRASIYEFVSWKVAKNMGVPLIAHLDAPFGIERDFHGESHWRWFHRRCMTRLGTSAHLVVTMSDYSCDYYVAMGIPREKILVIPNAVSLKLLQLADALAEEHLPLSSGRECVIGFAGSLSRWHRVDLLLHALRHLEADKYRLHIVGYGACYADLHASAKALGVSSRIRWLGALPHEQVFREIGQFDIAVLPNTLPTGAPLKLFEYAALARPIIAPDLPNLRRLFTSQEIYFVPPEDPEALVEAIIQLCDQPEWARGLGRQAQIRVRQEYTWEGVVRNILKSVENVT